MRMQIPSIEAIVFLLFWIDFGVLSICGAATAVLLRVSRKFSSLQFLDTCAYCPERAPSWSVPTCLNFAGTICVEPANERTIRIVQIGTACR